MAINVYIVEDDRNLRENIRKFINLSSGFECPQVFCSGEDVLLSAFEPMPDVVLMDINLPGMTGIECVARLKELMPGVQAVMLTVYEDTEQIFNALSAGASGYLLKRSKPSKLLEAIREVHEGGSPMSSSIARKVVASFQKSKATREKATHLSPREEMVLNCLAKGLTYKQIADQLGISIDTIRTYLRRIYEKLHVQSRTEAVARYLRL